MGQLPLSPAAWHLPARGEVWYGGVLVKYVSFLLPFISAADSDPTGTDYRVVQKVHKIVVKMIITFPKIGTGSIFKVFWCMVFWSKFNFCYSDLYPKSSLLIRILFKLIGIRNNDFHEFILNLTNYTVFYRHTGLDFWKLKLTGTRKPKVSYETPVLCVVLLTVRNGMVWNAYCIENKIN